MTGRSHVILLSGGLDSVVNVSMARRKGEILLALTFEYGQRAAQREIEAARNVCRYYAIPHRTLPLPWIKEMAPSCSLLSKEQLIPEIKREELDDSVKTGETARRVWVPNRNGLFIHVAAVFAESLGAGLITAGFNKEEGATFPDNSQAFLDAVNRSLEFSTLGKVSVISYTSGMDKQEIVRAGLLYGAPLEMIWSCYLGEEKMCGRCESCQRLKRGIEGTEAAVRMEERFQA